MHASLFQSTSMMSKTAKNMSHQVSLLEQTGQENPSTEIIVEDEEERDNTSPNARSRNNNDSPSPSKRSGSNTKNLKLQQQLNDDSRESLSGDVTNEPKSQSPSNRKLRGSRNSMLGTSTDMRTFDSNRRGKSVYGPSSTMEQILWKKKEYIGPGNIGTVKTLTLWNKASEITTGTTKTSTLRLDQYTSREDITK